MAGAKGDEGRAVVVLPNDAEARHLTDPLALELLLIGRPKPTAVALGLPQVQAFQHKEQLRCLLRLSRVSRVFLSVRAESTL